MTQPPNAVWHPMIHPHEMQSRAPLQIQSGDGVYVRDADGRTLLDGGAGLWCVNAGHNRKEIKEAIVRQLDELEYFQIFAGLSHPRAAELARMLMSFASVENMKRAVFSSGGSDAIAPPLR